MATEPFASEGRLMTMREIRFIRAFYTTDLDP